MDRGAAAFPGRVTMNADALVTAVEIEQQLPTVSRHLVYVWRGTGRLKARGKRGRSPLYRWGDVVKLEAATRAADPAGQRASRLAEHLKQLVA
jgi:hypothetical protein